MNKVSRIFFPLKQKIYEIAFDKSHEEFNIDDIVIVNHEDLGKNIAYIKGIDIKKEGNLCKEIKILRLATKKELETFEQREIDAMNEFILLKECAQKHVDDMNPISAQISLDGNLFYATFTAPDRIDFRELVKDLRTGIGYSQVNNILDGDITKILEDVLIFNKN